MLFRSEGVRYYGPSPEKVVETAREHPDVKGSVRGEAVFVRGSMKAPEQTALPANRGRTMKNRAAAGWQSFKNSAAAAAAGVKGKFQKKPAASGAKPAASGPTMKNRAAAAAASMKQGAKGFADKARAFSAGTKRIFARKANATRGTPEERSPLLSNLQQGGRRASRRQRR